MNYPYHPGCGNKVIVYRKRKRGGQEMYDSLDMHGGSTGIPTWMTEPHWKELRITDQPQIPLKIFQKLHALLINQSTGFNRNGNSNGGQCDDSKEAANTSTTAEVANEASERGNASGVDQTTCGAITSGTSK